MAKSWRMLLRYRNQKGKVAVRLAPGESYQLSRRIFPGAHLFDIRHVAGEIAGRKSDRLKVTVKDPAGHAVAGADVAFARDGKRETWGRTDPMGELTLDVGAEPGSLQVACVGHGTKEVPLTPPAPGSLTIEMPETATLSAKITDERGGTIPCKVQFIGRTPTASPDFGPDTGEHAVKNVYYSHDGRFQRKLEPGSYDVIVSHGPEYDAVFTTVEMVRGKRQLSNAR